MTSFGGVRVRAVLRLIVAFVLTAPLVCLSEDDPYFSVSAMQTYGTNQTPQIALAGWNVPAVQIRVYRVNNAVEFVRNLESSHSFGSEMPNQGKRRTVLERIHAWKRDLRRNIRLFIRGQFTESVSAHFQAPRAPSQQTKQIAGTYYAEAPVLNQDQLVYTTVQPIVRGDRWQSVNVPIPVKADGMYVVEAVSHRLRAYTILQKSNLVVVTKVGKQRLLAFVADRNSGAPVAEASISMLMGRHGQVTSVRTNADGLADLPVPSTGEAPADDELRVVAEKGPERIFSSVPLWSLNNPAQAWTGLLYTDRPVYRPGDAVHFRAIVRVADKLSGYSIPSGQTVAMQITDPDGKPVYEKHLTVSSTGVIHGDLDLPRTSALGIFSMQIAPSELSVTGTFEVQEYKKPEYDVRVLPDRPRVLEGEKATALIDSRYYFGEPVKGADVEYSIYRSPYWYPLWRNQDEQEQPFAAGEAGDQEEVTGEEVLKQTGKLDADGKLRIEFPTEVSEHKLDFTYRVEARVTDGARREISGHGWMTATYGTFLLNATPSRYVYDPGSTIDLKVEAVDYDGKPVAANAHISLQRRRGPRAIVETIASTNASISADGSATVQLQAPSASGFYPVHVTAPSAGGRVVETEAYIWVTGTGDFFWGGQSRTLQIVPDQKKYKVGDTAHILLVTGHANTPVFVTLEGRDVHWQKLLHSSGSTVSFDYKITVEDEPGIFISAVFVRNGELFEGSKRVSVPPVDHALHVDVSTDKPQYQPAQSAIYRLHATTDDGKPVPHTDFSLGVVDEAIYAIRPDATPDLLTLFYGNRGNAVSTQNSLTYYFSGEAGNRRMYLAQSARPTTRLAQIKPEPLVQPRIRKAFPDTAFWVADVTTDEQGYAQAKVGFPDSLTTWRATARGVTETDRFGSGSLKTIVRKNLILRLATPRFSVQGDTTVLSTIVQNYLPDSKHVRVSVALEGLDLQGASNTQELDVPSKGQSRIDWRVRTKQVSAAKITAQALTNEESDAVELALPVHPPGVRMTQGRGGSLHDSGTASLDVTFPSDAQAGSRSLVVRLSPSVAGSIFEALDFLTSYPYGCVEQTMSSFLPNLMVKKSIAELGPTALADDTKLNEQVKAGLERLYGMQHDDGGWGWWPSDASHPFMTAYVVAGLAEARADGVAIQAESLQKGISWLHTSLTKQDELAPDLEAYVDYALAAAGSVDTKSLDHAYARRTDMSPYGLALLGLAMEPAKDSRVGSLVEALLRAVKQDDQEAWWPATRDEMLDFEADVTPEATAYVVKFLSHQQRNNPLLPKAAVWLVNHRNEGYWWSSTKQTAMVIYGLIDYLKAGNELHPQIKASISVNGGAAETRAFDGSATGEQEIIIDDSKLQAGSNRITVTTSGSGRVYYSATATHYSDQQREERKGTIALNVLRDYFRLAPRTGGDHIVYDLQPLTGELKSGDVVAARLTVTGSHWRYLLAEDPIPAGAEFIEQDNLYELGERPPWWTNYFSRRELHDDHVAIFQSNFDEAQHQYFYLLKVVNPGLFHVSPARVSPMYQPEIQATTESKSFEVKP